MAAFARARRVYLAPAAEPNVIPFIDVLLVLLIIFMVTAPKPTIDLRVDLPRPGPIRVVAIRPTIVELHKTGGPGSRFCRRRGSFAREIGAAGAGPCDGRPAYAHCGRCSSGGADLDVAYNDVVATVENLQHARFRRVAIAAQRAQ